MFGDAGSQRCNHIFGAQALPDLAGAGGLIPDLINRLTLYSDMQCASLLPGGRKGRIGTVNTLRSAKGFVKVLMTFVMMVLRPPWAAAQCARRSGCVFSRSHRRFSGRNGQRWVDYFLNYY